jgi:hypothetical protein
MKKNGFTIFFAVLVTSLALAIGLAIYDLTVRELDLSATVNQSQYAIYAADTGAECALYWDTHCTASGCAVGSGFATSSNTNGGTFPPASGLSCDGQDIAAAGMPPSPFGSPPSGWTSWVVQSNASSATTTFWLFLGTPGGNLATSSCAMVTVAKSGSPTQTTVTAHGYNTCIVGGPTQLERALQVSY